MVWEIALGIFFMIHFILFGYLISKYAISNVESKDKVKKVKGLTIWSFIITMMGVFYYIYFIFYHFYQ